MRRNTHKESSRFIPNHHNDPIKDVVWILNVAKRTINKDFQQHLQCKETCEDDVADLQGIGKFLWLGKEEKEIEKTNSTAPYPKITCGNTTNPNTASVRILMLMMW